MKRPLQALLIAPDEKIRRAILEGTKTITIREGHRDYQTGTVMLCCHLEPWAVMAEITSVRHCTLAEVSEEEYKADGSPTREALLNGLQRYYPHLTPEAPVTVIRWQGAQGKLVEEYQRMQALKKSEREQHPPKLH